jgi:hypothetical protein
MQTSFPRSYSIAILSIACLLPLVGVAQERIPNVKLTVATQLEENGVLGSEINVLALRCFEGACRLTTVVLNRCIAVNGKSFQIPFTFGGTTQDGGIIVTRSGNSLSVKEVNTDVFGDTNATYRFVLAANQPSTLMATKLEGFSGVYVKDSHLAGKLITVKFVPLRGEYKRVDLACPIELPGLPRAGE